MTCSKRMEERIVHFAAGELAAPEAWLLRHHLRACETCRGAWSRTKALRQQLRARATCPTEPTLDARVLGSLSAARAALNPVPRRVFPSRAGLALGTVSLVAAATFPLWGPLPGVAAGDVRQGLAHVKTWHGQGWKTVDGRRVEWEVWGRRTPYLYWARLGDQIRVDNGRERLEVTTVESGGRSGVVLRTRSRPALDDWTIHPDRLFAAGPKEPHPDKAGWRTTTFTTRLKGETPLEARTVQFVVDRGANVPIQYVVRTGDESTPTDSLTLDYGAELPPSVTQPRWPEGYRTIDLLQTSPARTTSAPGMESAGAFTVQATPLSVDRSGNVLVRVRGWLAGVPLDTDAPFLTWVSDQQSGDSAPVATDERGRDYRYVPLQWLRLLQHLRLNGDRLMVFAPVQPLGRTAALPRRLTLKLRVAAAPSNRLTHVPGFDSVSVEESFRWNLVLPERPAPLRPEHWLGTGWREAVRSTGTPIESIEDAIARLRATKGE